MVRVPGRLGCARAEQPARAISLLISSRQAEAMTWIRAYRVKRTPNPPLPESIRVAKGIRIIIRSQTMFATMTGC